MRKWFVRVERRVPQNHCRDPPTILHTRQGLTTLKGQVTTLNHLGMRILLARDMEVIHRYPVPKIILPIDLVWGVTPDIQVVIHIQIMALQVVMLAIIATKGDISVGIAHIHQNGVIQGCPQHLGAQVPDVPQPVFQAPEDRIGPDGIVPDDTMIISGGAQIVLDPEILNVGNRQLIDDPARLVHCRIIGTTADLLKPEMRM